MLLHTRPLLPSYVSNDYKKFKSNFLLSFGASQTPSSLDWMFQFAEAILSKANIQSPQAACAIAADFGILAFNALKSSKWLTNNAIPIDNMQQWVENLVFLVMSAGNKHSTAVSYLFEPDLSLLPLTEKLTQSDTSFPVSEVLVPPVNDVPVSAPTRVPCKYCEKSNHHFSRCYHKPKPQKHSPQTSSPLVTTY